MNHLVALFNSGRYIELESMAHLMVGRYPDSGFIWKALGTALLVQGKEALPALQKAAQLLPDDAEGHSNLGSTLRTLGRLDEAVASYRRALKIKPDYAEAHNNLGSTLHALGRLDEAAASYRRALEIKPDYAEAHSNLGIALHALGRQDEAVASYRRALEIKPDYAETHSNLGISLCALGRQDEAVASYRRALEIQPDYAEAHYNLGNVLQALGRLDEAVAGYRRAVELKPDYAEAHYNLGSALQALGRLDEAVTSYRRALELKPDYVEAHNNLGYVLTDLGQYDGGAASYRRALELKPHYADAHSNLLFCLSQSEAVGAPALFAEHCRFAEQFEAPLQASWPQHAHTRDPERCLRVGFVSADFRTHAVASFIEPVLMHLAKCPQLSLHAYYNNIIEDSVTQRLRGYLPGWQMIAGLSDDALAQKIRADGIDILIDLSGHTAGHRLLGFARKPAPVQASWIGYPGTTGLQAMDYYFSDRFFLPPGRFDDQFTEKIVRLPASAPFLPFKESPAVSALPALNNGYVTFGSFNRMSKIGRPVIALWASLLRALPHSRMLLGGLPKGGECNTLIEWFAQEGITRERLDFHAHGGMDAYLGLHHEVDICLDTFPYSGGTTTLHALWMGVPTLTLAGSTAAGRTGAFILGHVGLEAFVAQNKTEFAEKGLRWAGNLEELSDIRAGLRERFANSAMAQPAVVAEGVERALRIMWKRWCAGLSPESFEVTSLDVGGAMQEAGK